MGIPGEAGTASYLTSHDLTLSPSGKEVVYPTNTVYTRARALLLSPATESIVTIAQTDEFLETGLPFEFIDQLTVIDNNLLNHSNNMHPATPERCEQLTYLLRCCVDHVSK